MAIYTENKIIDQITVTEKGHILFREATSIYKDGQEISKTYHRSSLFPGQSLIDIPLNVANIANVVWTPEVLSDYQASLTANTAS